MRKRKLSPSRLRVMSKVEDLCSEIQQVATELERLSKLLKSQKKQCNEILGGISSMNG